VRRTRTQIAPSLGSLIVWVVLVVSFIPLCRLLDSRFPTSYMGFQLLGIWLFGVLPVFAVLGAVSLFIARSDSILRQNSRARFVLVTSVIYLLVFIGFLLDYRCGGPF
jgi:hypothetical protein